MPRYKVLKGVAHNIGHSFTSSMNYSGDDYSMGHILRFAQETGLDTLTIDFVTGEGRPSALLRDPITEIPHWYSKTFWNMVTRSGSDRALVQSATLTLKYDLLRTRPGPIADTPQSPYACHVLVVDARGKNYSAYLDGWWHVERGLLAKQKCEWWNPMQWFRH
jgi:hypothetical protein